MSKIAIISPVYKAWPMVKKMCETIDQNTTNDFYHILVADSCDWPEEFSTQVSSFKRQFLKFDDGEPPEKHRACITKATQMAFDFILTQEIPFDYLFYIETDVMVPKDWDYDLINLSKELPEDWKTLDVYPVNEQNQMEYPAHQNVARGRIVYKRHDFQIIQYADWNAVLFNPKVVEELRENKWRFDDVPSHHDILLSRNMRERLGYERENWEPPTFFRTEEVRAIHYPNSSRSELPEGLKTPSHPR